MSSESRSGAGIVRSLVALACAGILCVILVAGLWPFHAPTNGVGWLPGANGIRFRHRGIVVSSKPFAASSAQGPVTLEICLQPARLSASGTILTLDDNPDPRFLFAIRQFDRGLAVQRPALDATGKLVRQWWRINEVFTEPAPVVLTITAVPGTTSLWLNGVLASTSPDLGLTRENIAGTLILGNSATQDTWSGDIRGLAVYDGLLTGDQIEQHSRRWLQGQSPIAAGESPPLALYRFAQLHGSVIRDEGTGANDLLIRPHYFLLHPGYLTPVWVPFRSRWDGWRSKSYWSDVVVNIAGFIPFGFFFALWFSLLPAIRRPRLTTFFLGVALSFAIESIQYFLPTRDSSMTDLLTNSMGTAIGVLLCRPVLFQRLRPKTTTAGAIPQVPASR